MFGVAAFTYGFLLSRVELSVTSSCSDFREELGHLGQPASSSCWGEQQVNKTVWIIIDALRADFVTNTKLCNSSVTNQSPLGQMHVLRDVAMEAVS